MIHAVQFRPPMPKGFPPQGIRIDTKPVDGAKLVLFKLGVRAVQTKETLSASMVLHLDDGTDIELVAICDPLKEWNLKAQLERTHPGHPVIEAI